MTVARHLDWPGCHNVRDLGGLPTRGGGRTAWRQIVRGDAPDHLTAAGWAALRAYGIRTIVDLRGEAGPASGARTVRVPLDDLADKEFWQRWGGGLDCTPLYYRAFLDRFPSRVARAVASVADAPAGGVLVHCAGGRDRTGLVVMLLLALAGVPPELIAADYALSAARLEPVWAALGAGDQTGKVAAVLSRHGTTAENAIVAVLDSLDVADYLLRSGMTEAQVAAVRTRLNREPA